MTARSAPSARRLPPALLALAWVAVAVIAFYALFWLISFVLARAPEPIGSRAGLFVEGARITLLLTLSAGVLGLVLGVLAGLARLTRWWPLRALAAFYVWVIRGTPLIVQIFFVYYALPVLLPPFNALLSRLGSPGAEIVAGILALALNVGAYNAEVVRAGVLAVPRGQAEAARSLGLSGFLTMVTIILPQAFRIVVPPLVNNLVALLKDSSLTSVIAVTELFTIADRIRSETFQPVPVLTTIALVYLLLTTVLTFFTDALERRLRVSAR